MKKLEIIPLCGACPEDYDIQINGVQCAYARLRHGVFRVVVPDYGGEVKYVSNNVNGDGIFDCDEREYYLSIAKYKAIEWYSEHEELDEDL